MFSAETQVFTVAVYFVRQNPLRITARPLAVSLDGADQKRRFVVRVKRQRLKPCPPVYDADIQLRAELNLCLRFAPNNRSDMRLRQADNPVLCLVSAIIIHVLLLFVDLLDGG